MPNEAKNVQLESQPFKDDTLKRGPRKQTFLQRLRYLKSNITVEPIFAGLIIPSMIARLAVQNLNLDKACRVNLAKGDDICNALITKTKNLTKEEGEVQEIISAIEAWRSVIQTAIPTILVILMGAWSDRTGNRKICILLPVIGEFLVCVSNLISTYFFYEIPVELTMFFESFFPAITGGWVMVYLGVFSYISDITSEKDRTFRVGLVNLCLTAGIPIGTALSGILLKLWGYYGVFILSGSIYLMTFTYGLIYLKSNTKPNNQDEKLVKPLKVSDTYALVKETVKVAVRKREGNYRLKIILCLLVVALVYGPNHGERVFFYYFLRYRLGWDAVKYSFYSTYSVIAHSLGALFSISVFSKRWRFHDSMLCLISVVSKLIGSIYIMNVYSDFQMFMLPLVEILNATTFTSLRSLASKLISSEEMGKMNSLFSLVETLAALVFDPTYSTLYYLTVDSFTAAVFLYSALMTLPAIAVLIWFFIQHRKERKEQRLKGDGASVKEEVVINETIDEDKAMDVVA